MTDIQNQLSEALGYLSSLFDLQRRVYFEVNNRVQTSRLVEVTVRCGDYLKKGPINKPVTAWMAGFFVGRELYEIVNPDIFVEKNRAIAIIRQRVNPANYIIEGARNIQAAGEYLRHIRTQRKSTLINIVSFACGRTFAESKGKATKGFNLPKKDMLLFEELYRTRGEEIIKDLARLSLDDARVKIIELIQKDFFQEQEN
jgi:hypothetical protein